MTGKPSGLDRDPVGHTLPLGPHTEARGPEDTASAAVSLGMASNFQVTRRAPEPKDAVGPTGAGPGPGPREAVGIAGDDSP